MEPNETEASMSDASRGPRGRISVVLALCVLSLLLGAGVLALLLGVAAPGVAARLITGQDIRDGAVTSADLRDNSVQGQDVRAGSLRLDDILAADRAAERSSILDEVRRLLPSPPSPTPPPIASDTHIGAFSFRATGNGRFFVPLPEPAPFPLVDKFDGPAPRPITMFFGGVNDDFPPGSTNAAACQGTVHAPSADVPGVLCVYVEQHDNVKAQTLRLEGGVEASPVRGPGERLGFQIIGHPDLLSGSTAISGTWAYSAP
jgi:hypothetical protein